MATEAIDALADSSPAEWISHRTGNGERVLEVLHQQCQAAGLVPHTTPEDPVACLHALFDVALKEGLGEVVVDYVAEVCSDPFLTSADPVEAYLMDGRCVQQWAQRTLQRCRARFLQALQQGLSEPGTAAAVATEVARLQGLLPVLQALVQPGGQPGSEGGEVEEAARLLQAAQVAEWAGAAAAGAGARWGHYASHAEWRLVANRRRDLSAPLPLFLQHLLERLRDMGCEVAAYPFSSLENAIEMFLSGSTAAECWHTKLATLVYALTDAGCDIPVNSIGQAFGVDVCTVALWQSHFWLDDAARGADAAESLEAACRSLPGIADGSTPFEVVEALAAREAPVVALAVQRCRGHPAANLAQALSLLQIRLACNLLTEAAVEVQRFLASPAAAADASAAPALAAELAEWAADSCQLQSLAQLPMASGLEAALLEWLQEAARGGRIPAAQLPLFLLQRGRLSDAAAASASIDAAIAAGTMEEAEGVTQQRRVVMAAAARLLPRGAHPDTPAVHQPLHSLHAPMPTPPLGRQFVIMQGNHEATVPETATDSHPADQQPTPAVPVASGQAAPVREGWASRPQRSTRSTAKAASQGGDAGQEMDTEEQAPAADATAQMPAAAARPMQEDEWQHTMGISPEPRSTGPRTRQAAKRQRLAAMRR